jgi:hypothetical protein
MPISAVTERKKCRGGGPHGAHYTAVYKPGARGGLWASVSPFDGCFLRGSPLARVPLSVTRRNGDNRLFCAD